MDIMGDRLHKNLYGELHDVNVVNNAVRSGTVSTRVEATCTLLVWHRLCHFCVPI
jgi:hypothetical protein